MQMEKHNAVVNMEFNKWKIQIKLDRRRAVHNNKLHLDYQKQTFIIRVGLRPGKYKGIQYTLRDMPLMEAHEIEHVLLKLEGWDNGCMHPLFAIYREEKIDIAHHILLVEKLVWQRVFSASPWISLEWQEKIGDCLTSNVFSLAENFGITLNEALIFSADNVEMDKWEQ